MVKGRKQGSFSRNGDLMDIVEKEQKKPLPKNGAFGLGTWEGALSAAKRKK